jgi:hypothetical protein
MSISEEEVGAGRSCHHCERRYIVQLDRDYFSFLIIPTQLMR